MRRVLGLVVAGLLVGGSVAVAGATEEQEPPRREDPPKVEVPATPYVAGPSGPPVPAGALAAATWEAPSQLAVPAPPAPAAGLPPGVPPAALRAEPTLPEADGWTFGDGFPRTSGAGRYADGAFFWSDFIYDDNGAIGLLPPTNESTGAPSFGTYKYPAENQRGNGADLFRVAIGHRQGGSVWRVDWNTLTDPTVPIAAFAIDHDPSAGAGTWPANAGISSPGTDTVLTLSGRTGRVIDLATGAATDLPVTVDAESRSFLLDVPDALLPTNGTAVVRVAAGLASPDGRAFATLTTAHGALPGQPNVYNVGFRDYGDEPSASNPWYDTGQARALTAGGDVSAFSTTLDWGVLAAGRTDPEPIVTGFTNRWYVSSIELGQGVVSPGQGISVNGPAAYVGRVQPYGIFVPTGYDGSPVPVTWMLHGASSSHNSSQIHPRFLDAACEQRTSICLSPLGRGPSGGWRGVAELDVWEVWNRVAAAFALDPDRTALSGISMGGFGTYQLAADHPEAFASAAAQVANAQRAGYDRVTNYRWIPLYARHGAFDQLVPITTELETQQHLDAAGLRHVFDFLPAEDHVAIALKDGYDDVADFFKRELVREVAPARVTYAWSAPGDADLALGLDRVGAYWLDGVAVRDPGTRGRMDATSHALPNRPYTVVTHKELRPLASPSPTMRTVMDWEFGEAPPTSAELDATFTNVAAVTIDLAHAGLGQDAATLTITTDGPTCLTLGGIGGRKARIDGRGRPLGGAFDLPAGTHAITIR